MFFSFSFFYLIVWRCRFFGAFFVPFRLSLRMENRVLILLPSYVLSFRMRCFVNLVTTGWRIFYISLLLCENSINQINQRLMSAHVVKTAYSVTLLLLAL